MTGTLAPETWLALAIVAIGALLRFDGLGHQSFWVDEATTVHEVGLSFGAMLKAIAHNEATPPLYFACSWLWTRVFGADALAIRSFSALVGTAMIAVMYLCGRELIARWAGLIAALLTAVSPYMIWYSQEARAYILLALLSALSLLFSARARRTGRPIDLLAWALVAALALATHFFAGLLVLPEGAWLLWRLRRRGATVALAGAVGVVVAVQIALLPLAINDAGHPLDTWIGGLPLSSRIQAIPVDFAASQLYITPTLRWGLWGAAGAALLLALLTWRSSAAQRAQLALPAALATIVLAVPLIAAVLGRDYVFARNLTPAWIPLVVLIGGAVGAERARSLGALTLAAIIVIFVWADVRIGSDPSLQRPDWRAVAAALGPATVPRAVLIYDGNVAEEPLSLYLPGTRFSYSGAPATGPRLAVGEIDVVADLAATPARRLAPGFRDLGVRYVAGASAAVVRFRVDPARVLTPQTAAALAHLLVVPVQRTPSVLIQK